MTSTVAAHPVLTDLLSEYAGTRPAATAFTFLGEESATRQLTYAELDRQARAIASSLAERLRPGDRVMLLLPDEAEFVPTFLGCLLAGLVAVPAYPPVPPQFAQRLETLRAIAADCTPRAVVLPDGFEDALRQAVPELAGAWCVPTTDLVHQHDIDAPHVPVEPEDLAFLQYTSGSTGTPKGVMVTHRALLHNQRMIAAAIGSGPGLRGVGWLPLFHDMGLIGQMLHTLYSGGHCAVMSPVTFLKRPIRWLRAISDHRAEYSPAPDFAYEMCVRRVRDSDCEGLDLSSWKVAFNGAEPVRTSTMDAFTARFSRYGFDPAAFYPCYGLAESTLFVAGGAVTEPPTRITVDETALQRGEVAPSDDGRTLVGCGIARLDRELRIVAPDTGQPVEQGRIGEIWIAGRDVAAGYWNRPDDTAATFGARTTRFGDGPYLKSGDLGFLHGNELFVTGRCKDLIVVEGRNHYPDDIEATVTATETAVHRGSVVAFSVDDGERERVVLVLSLNKPKQEGIAQRLRSAIASAHGITVHDVVVVGPGAIPRTSSGKVRRGACRTAYLNGEYAQTGSGS